METLRLRVDWQAEPNPHLDAAALDSIAQAAQILRTGGIVAIPTETVYGLAANALNPIAVAKIFAAKGRPGWDPLIVHVADEAMLARVAGPVSPDARKLMAAFWPGPLTLLLPRTSSVPDSVTAGRPLVGVRMPSHPVALAVLRLAGVPLAAPSANRFGHTSPTTASHVLDDLDGRIDAVLDAGPSRVGVESTVVDTTQSPMVIYRPGAITADQMRAIGVEAWAFPEPAPGTVLTASAGRSPESLVSPGLGLRHYAPRAQLILVETAGTDPAARLSAAAASAAIDGEMVGILLPTDWQIQLPAARPGSDGPVVYPWGPWHDLESLAARLFAGLRELDAAGVTRILCPVPTGEGVGAAINDRLRKAAMAP